MFEPVSITRIAFIHKSSVFCCCCVCPCSSKHVLYICTYIYVIICVFMDVQYVRCVSNICNLKVTGCTCQIEMWGCSVIFM